MQPRGNDDDDDWREIISVDDDAAAAAVDTSEVVWELARAHTRISRVAIDRLITIRKLIEAHLVQAGNLSSGSSRSRFIRSRACAK